MLARRSLPLCSLPIRSLHFSTLLFCFLLTATALLIPFLAGCTARLATEVCCCDLLSPTEEGEGSILSVDSLVVEFRAAGFFIHRKRRCNQREETGPPSFSITRTLCLANALLLYPRCLRIGLLKLQLLFLVYSNFWYFFSLSLPMRFFHAQAVIDGQAHCFNATQSPSPQIQGWIWRQKACKICLQWRKI